MLLLLMAMTNMICAGTAALLFSRYPKNARIFGAAGPVLGCALGLPAALGALYTGNCESFSLPWQIPYGSFSLELDGLSAFFLIPMLIVSATAALYGVGYLKKTNREEKIGRHWFFYNSLCASMVMVTLCANGILFLFAWEVMSIASFFLVTYADETPSVRDAGWVYLVAAHLGGAVLFVLFLLLGQAGGSLDFKTYFAVAEKGPIVTGIVFLLSIIGFGAKAGFIPFHVWLPEAHPAAPSHVSALMSGVMIKTGIYGILRTLTFLGHPAPWWGWVLLGIGILSGVLGVLFALVQHDLKRLLAYHSVENIGIITMGIGFGLLGLANQEPLLAVLGLAGGLLHVLNHALFKGLLFMCAGAVLHETGTREIDLLGGLGKRMPWTSGLFFLGAVAISGLPPLNGFVSEFLIYLASYHGMGFDHFTAAGVMAITGLAVIGTLAVACFTKAFGIVFLGEPRTDHAKKGHEVDRLMRTAMLLPALGCVAIGIGAPMVPKALLHVLRPITGMAESSILAHLAFAGEPLQGVVAVSMIGFLLFLFLFILRKALLNQRTMRESVTWDCGYLEPASRMQYSASSFAQPIKRMVQTLIPEKRREEAVEGPFPHHASLATETPDIFQVRLFIPLFRTVERVMIKWHGLQQGRVQLYILYVAVTLLILLVWNLR